MQIERATLTDGRTIEFVVVEDPPSGSMKVTFFNADRSSVVQFFRDQQEARDPQRLARLEAVLGHFNPTLDPVQGDYWRSLFCWPTGIAVRPGIGVVAPAYPANYYFASGPFQGKQKEGRWFTSPRLWKMLPREERGDWRGYFQICLQLARAIRRLHQAGAAHADLSSRNVLVDPVRGAATVIDIDALVVPGLFPPDVLGTPGYIAPEVLATLHLPLQDAGRELPGVHSDRHALAVLIYEYLLRRHPLRGPKIHSADSAEDDERLALGEGALFIEHPTDHSNRPDDLDVALTVLGPSLTELCERAFVGGLHAAAERPTALDWELALLRTWELLHPCGNAACERGWFVLNPESAQTQCSFCGWRPEPAVPVLRSRERIEVLFHEKSLFRWHVFADAHADETADRAPVAYCAWHEGRWLLVNQGLPGLTEAGTPVPLGQALELRPGVCFRFGPEESCRTVEVAFVGHAPASQSGPLRTLPPPPAQVLVPGVSLTPRTSVADVEVRQPRAALRVVDGALVSNVFGPVPAPVLPTPREEKPPTPPEPPTPAPRRPRLRGKPLSKLFDPPAEEKS